MRTHLSIGLSALSCLVAVSASAQTPANRRPDLNAFVNRKVKDTPSLVAQVKNDPEVADRYERHFSMSRYEIVRYLGTLHRSTLAKGGVYTVYSVPEGGRVKMHLERLKKGAPIFADATGAPTLILKCGNPVVLGPSRVRRGNPLVLAPTGTDKVHYVSMLTPQDSPDMVAFEALPPAVPDPVLPDVVPQGGGESVAVVDNITSVPLASAGSRFPLAALLPLGLLGFIHNGGNGGDVTPVPEPATLVVVGLGLAGVAARRRRA